MTSFMRERQKNCYKLKANLSYIISTGQPRLHSELLSQKAKPRSGVVTYAFNPSTQKAEAEEGRSLLVPGQCG